MKKYVYEVVKSFSIYSEDGKTHIANTEEEEKKGSTFKKSSNYVDYQIDEEDLEITATLKEKGFIKLIDQSESKKR